MADQLRYNTGKPQYHYWYSTRLAAFLQNEAGLCSEDDGPVSAEAAAADRLLRHLTDWLNGQIEHRDLIRYWYDVSFELGLSLPSLYTEVCEYGASKYARGNFRKGQSVCHYADCAIRHLKLRIGEQALDTESGKTHFGHAWWNIAQIFEIMEQPEVAALRDDRLFKHGDLSGR